jgi:hypothetical protein
MSVHLGDFVLDLEFLALEVVDSGGIGKRAIRFVLDRGLESRVPGFQGIDPLGEIHHRVPPIVESDIGNPSQQGMLRPFYDPR